MCVSKLLPILYDILVGKTALVCNLKMKQGKVLKQCHISLVLKISNIMLDNSFVRYLCVSEPNRRGPPKSLGTQARYRGPMAMPSLHVQQGKANEVTTKCNSHPTRLFLRCICRNFPYHCIASSVLPDLTFTSRFSILHPFKVGTVRYPFARASKRDTATPAFFDPLRAAENYHRFVHTIKLSTSPS